MEANLSELFVDLFEFAESSLKVLHIVLLIIGFAKHHSVEGGALLGGNGWHSDKQR